MREHDEKNCNINDQVHDTPPANDCGHNVMEGPGMQDGQPIPKAEGKVIRKDSASGGPEAN